MRRMLFPVLAIVAAASVFNAPPAHAKTMTGTIAVPLADFGTWTGAGYGNFLPVDDVSAVRRSCPKAGEFDGLVYKWFDLKGGFTKFKASGPKVLFNQETPVGSFADYDLDLYLLDAKCKRIVVTGSNTGGATEKQSVKKPAAYAVIVYWQGHTPNIPVTLEFS